MNQRTLAELFRKLGANDPDRWATSQLEEGIPQLARFLFLRQAWRCIVDETEPQWINDAIARSTSHPNEPFAGVGLSLASLRVRGATDSEISDLVRGMQAKVLFSLCYLLENPGDVEPEVQDMTWALVQVDDDGNVLGSINGLHESVLETDPTGREMRPRDAG